MMGLVLAGADNKSSVRWICNRMLWIEIESAKLMCARVCLPILSRAAWPVGGAACLPLLANAGSLQCFSILEGCVLPCSKSEPIKRGPKAHKPDTKRNCLCLI